MNIQLGRAHGYLLFVAVLLFAFGLTNRTMAQGTSFNYQGRLQDGGANANGSYDFQFTLWDALSGGTQQPQSSPITVTRSSVAVANGVFTTQLDFGAAAFPGADRFLETSVRLSGAGSFILLAPRQPVTSTPYAVRSASAGAADTAATATNATQLGGLAAGQYVLISDSRLTDARAPTAGSANYIQNTTSQQAGSSFNISGDGTAAGTLSGNTVNSSTTLNIAGNKVMSVTGDPNFPTSNTFAGVGTGTKTAPNTNGDGDFNSFYGSGAGFFNTTGKGNSFFGSSTGQGNTTGTFNSFFGMQAGASLTTGSNNSFFGFSAGQISATAHDNSSFGANAGRNQSGNFNTYIGGQAGANTSGDANTFVGYATGAAAGQGGSNTTLVGSSAALGSANLTNATAIGAQAVVSSSNSLVLGQLGTNVGIGTASPSSRLHVVGDTNMVGNLTVSGTLNATLPANSASYIQNTTTQQASSNFNISGNGTVGGNLNSINIITGNVFAAGARISSGLLVAPLSVLDVVSPTGQDILLGGGSATGSEIKLTNSGTAHFSIYNSGNSKLTFANTSANITDNDPGTPRMVITSTGNVGIGTTTPAAGAQLQVAAQTRTNTLLIENFVGGVGSINLCTTGSGGNANLVGTCSSSLRYKTNVQSFRGGLNIINRLRPITFDWKEGGGADLGLAAEEVNRVEPLLTFRNNKGEIEGVRYNQLSALFINAFKEQQSQIESQQALIQQQQQRERGQQEMLANQQRQIDALKKLVCQSHRKAAVCR
jgi:hypothetical protein